MGAKKLKATFKTMERNQGGRTDTYTVTVTRSGTVSSTISKSVEAEAGGGFGFFSASLKTQFGMESTQSTTAERGEQVQVQVPPHRQVEIRYGVWTRRLKGVILQDQPNYNISPVPWPPNCHKGLKGQFTVTVTTPETGFVKSKPEKIDS
jgi:hypothetical protein